MFRVSAIIIIAFLLAVICLQHASRKVLENECKSLRTNTDGLELTLARTRGELTGLSLTTEAKRILLWNALLSSRSRVSELRQTVEQKEHYITSLEQGHMLLVTAYTNSVEETDDTPNITASGARVRDGIIAVSRDLFNNGWVFGRQVYVKDLGVFTIEDLMNKRWTKKIDIFMFSKQRAIQFGRQNLRVYLLGDG